MRFQILFVLAAGLAISAAQDDMKVRPGGVAYTLGDAKKPENVKPAAESTGDKKPAPSTGIIAAPAGDKSTSASADETKPESSEPKKHLGRTHIGMKRPEQGDKKPDQADKKADQADKKPVLGGDKKPVKPVDTAAANPGKKDEPKKERPAETKTEGTQTQTTGDKKAPSIVRHARAAADVARDQRVEPAKKPAEPTKPEKPAPAPRDPSQKGKDAVRGGDRKPQRGGKSSEADDVKPAVAAGSEPSRDSTVQKDGSDKRWKGRRQFKQQQGGSADAGKDEPPCDESSGDSGASGAAGAGAAGASEAIKVPVLGGGAAAAPSRPQIAVGEKTGDNQAASDNVRPAPVAPSTGGARKTRQAKKDPKDSSSGDSSSEGDWDVAADQKDDGKGDN